MTDHTITISIHGDEQEGYYVECDSVTLTVTQPAD